jgi:hypothetical protein
MSDVCMVLWLYSGLRLVADKGGFSNKSEGIHKPVWGIDLDLSVAIRSIRSIGRTPRQEQ